MSCDEREEETAERRFGDCSSLALFFIFAPGLVMLTLVYAAIGSGQR